MSNVDIDTSKPEFAPLKEFIRTYWIDVVIYDYNDNVVREEHLDYGNPKHKVWLGKLSFWAWSNNYYVETGKSVNQQG